MKFINSIKNYFSKPNKIILQCLFYNIDGDLEDISIYAKNIKEAKNYCKTIFMKNAELLIENGVGDIKTETETIEKELSKDTLSYNYTGIKRIQIIIKKLEGENKELSEKVEEAAPYFDLKEEERLAVEAEAKAKEEARIAEEKRKEEERLAALEARKVTLTPGNYVAGSDFEPGKYNIICIGGSGNVISSDFSINLIMAPTSDGFYINEYKNAKLNTNVNLQVERCTIKLVPVE